MALEIKNQTIVGIIDSLEEKLNGELPINRLELIKLIDSWGRDKEFYTNENIKISECESKERYDLSKLDTSKITDMSNLFQCSLFNGDISNWNTSNVTNTRSMFYLAKSFNQPLDKWNLSHVLNMEHMFNFASNFNQALNNWDVSNVKYMSNMFRSATNFNQAILWDFSKVEILTFMFYEAQAFQDKFNNGNPLPNDTNNLKQWLKENSDKMFAIDIKEREKENLDSFYNNLESLYNNLDKENMH